MSKNTYCGIERMSLPIIDVEPLSYGDTPEDGRLLGDKILEAALYGADLGNVVPVTYDEDVVENGDSHEVDVLSSPNHDFFDIAENFGHLVEPMVLQPGDDDGEDD